jgi:hypothetical protein
MQKPAAAWPCGILALLTQGLVYASQMWRHERDMWHNSDMPLTAALANQIPWLV